MDVETPMKRTPPPLPTKAQLQAQRSGPLLSVTDAIDKKVYASDFKEADADNSGKLGREEVDKYLTGKGFTVDHAYLDELMSVFDADGSGDIDPTEFTGLVRLMISHEKAVSAAADRGGEPPRMCCGQECSRFCGAAPTAASSSAPTATGDSGATNTHTTIWTARCSTPACRTWP